MIHPDTELKVVSAQIGLGVFATKLIPAGTMTYVKDLLEIELPPDSPLMEQPAYRAVVDRYSYIDAAGMHIISWDIAKYVNHHCEPNSLSTGYGFEVATRDIEAGEQITDDYGMFNMTEVLDCCCGSPQCRGRILADDLLTYRDSYDERVRAALGRFRRVPQPLLGMLDADTHGRLMRYLHRRRGYVSVEALLSQQTSAVGAAAMG